MTTKHLSGKAPLRKSSPLPPALTLSELGGTGLARSGGFVTEELLKELAGQKGMLAYREMRDNDPIIGAFLFAIEMLIRQVKWSVDPGSKENDDQIAAQLCDSLRDDMSMTWADTITEILSMLVFGFSPHELVYKIRGGDTLDPLTRSAHSDGLIGWKKLPIRSQESVWRWHFTPEGEITAMEQMPPPDYTLRVIPMEKLLLFRTKMHKNNPFGRSVLRNAYRPWYFKKNIENIEAIGVERDLAGLPCAWIPPEYMSADATPAQKTFFSEMKKIVTQVRRDEQEGLIFPLAYDELGKPLFDFKLLSTSGTRQFDTDKVINRYDQRIAMTVLGDFLLMGHQQVGSHALHSGKKEIFSVALGAWCDTICEVFNNYAFPRLLALNGIRCKSPPKLVHGDIEQIDLKELGDYVKTLTGIGMPLFPDKNLESYLRRAARLPEPMEEDEEGLEGEAEGEGAAIPLATDQKRSDVTLNGGQMDSARAIVADVAAKRIPRESGVALMAASLNFTMQLAEEIMGPTGKTFYVEATPAPAVVNNNAAPPKKEPKTEEPPA